MEEDVFDTDEEIKDRVQPLISESYDYENMINNPILKPISECDKTTRDLEEMKIKTLKDSKKVMAWVNQTLHDNPEYNNIYFVSQLIDILKKDSFVVKIDSLQIDKYRDCIVEMYKLTMSNYAVRGDDEKYYKPESKKENELDYLTKISSHEDPKVAEISKLILENYKEDEDNEDSKKRFNDACLKLYQHETDLDKQKIMARIMRREYQK